MEKHKMDVLSEMWISSFFAKNIWSKQLKNKDLVHCIGGLVITFASCLYLLSNVI